MHTVLIAVQLQLACAATWLNLIKDAIAIHHFTASPRQSKNRPPHLPAPSPRST